MRPQTSQSDGPSSLSMHATRHARLIGRAGPLLALVRGGPRYIAIAVFCVLLHNAIMITLDAVGVHYGIGLLVSAAVLIPLGFVLHAVFTFSATMSWYSFLCYSVVVILNTPLSFVSIWLLHDVLEIAVAVAVPVSTVVLFVWNFLSTGATIKRPTGKALG